jgi:hypothetical protein
MNFAELTARRLWNVHMILFSGEIVQP